MKIYCLPTPEKLQPKVQGFTYPKHNKDYGVEQDFFDYINSNPDIIAKNPKEADWHYLPVFWTRWHLNHNYGHEGQSELQQEVDKIIMDDSKTFTICQYDDGPVVEVGKTILFLASRKSINGIDIPLLSSPHKLPLFKPKKKYLASFMGRMANHPIRQEIATILSSDPHILIQDGDKGPRFFVKNTLASYICLAPRGYGGSSFRLFEAMQMNVVPFLIGDLDTRPFKSFIDWNQISFYAGTSAKMKLILEKQRVIDPNQLLSMGNLAKALYDQCLTYQKWCPFVLKELNNLK